MVLKPNVGEFGGDFNDGGAPELRDFEDVGLVDGAELLAALLGEREGDAGDADNLISRIAHGVPGLALGFVPLPRLAEVEAAEKLADEENVCAVDDFGAQRRVDGEFFEGKCGAEICKAAESCPNGKKAGFGTLVRGEGVEFVAADCAEENGVGGEGGGEGVGGQGRAVGGDGDAADALVVEGCLLYTSRCV